MSPSIEIKVPDIGDFDEVEVVEILVAKGDVVAIDDPLVSIESDKATMEIPSTVAGTIVELRVAEGDRVGEGSILVLVEADGAAATETTQVTADGAPSTDTMQVTDDGGRDEMPAPEAPQANTTQGAADDERGEEPTTQEMVESESVEAETDSTDSARTAPARRSKAPPRRTVSPAAAHPVPDRPDSIHASPLVRRYARELGVPLSEADGTGPHKRVLVDDLKRRVAKQFAEPARSGSGAAIPAVPAVDFAAFGPIHEQPLTRIQKVSGPALHRSWLNVPHVTQHDEADVTELERFRKSRREEAAARGVKLSPLLFVMKAVVGALREFPTLRSSLSAEGDRLFVKDFFHLGIAVDTDQGLVVPVIRDVDQKGIFELAEEVSATAERARNRKLGPDDLRGAVFTISSLGGIGGTSFSPIVNAPEVAILGLSKTQIRPVWRGASPADEIEGVGDPEVGDRSSGFEPRLMLPLSLSYDHRVVDGAEAVRFTTRLARIVSDPLMLLL
jgi:pyruvate dehydrogenase E2 component (dihydrolipoamide acetyltransferase)